MMPDFQKKCTFAHLKFNLIDMVGTIAQQVEQRTENPCVTGSIPVGATHKKRPLGGVFFNSLLTTEYSLLI